MGWSTDEEKMDNGLLANRLFQKFLFKGLLEVIDS